MMIDIFDVEMGQCAIVTAPNGRIALVDCGHKNDGWTPSAYLKRKGYQRLDHLIITNADQDHFSDLEAVVRDFPPGTFTRAWGATADQMELVKIETCGWLTADAERYLALDRGYSAPVPEPFEVSMAGVHLKTFCNSYADFQDTNNLSLAAFFAYGNDQILFPGDLEVAGWQKLLENRAFITELQRTTILVAAHHGRENGYCEEVFKYCKPKVVVISDKSHMHDTQATTHLYNARVSGNGIPTYSMSGTKLRKVLTTRNDGDIRLVMEGNQLEAGVGVI